MPVAIPAIVTAAASYGATAGLVSLGGVWVTAAGTASFAATLAGGFAGVAAAHITPSIDRPMAPCLS